MPLSKHSDMIYRLLGRTGRTVSAIGLGGWHLALPHVDESLAIRLVRTSIDRGINFLDNCWDYNDGEVSGEWVGLWPTVIGTRPF